MKGMGFRQSNAWLHTWSGLILGWLMFTIFVTGTVCFFRDEISVWMKPELHNAQAGTGPAAAIQAVAAARAAVPGATDWIIRLPNERNPAVLLRWWDADKPAATNRAAVAMLDAASGEVLQVRETRGADFLYRFHFELYGMPRITGRWIVGAASMAMLVALLTGIVTHKKIFADFFTLRRRKGQRSWMDVHNILGVLALPFYLVIVYSGLVLLFANLMPWAINTVYKGDVRAVYEDMRGDIFALSKIREPAPPGVAPLADLAPMIAAAARRWPQGIGSISVAHAGTPGAVVELQARSSPFLTGRGWGERLRFNGVTGEPLAPPQPPETGGAASVFNVATTLHTAHFAGPWLRWLGFASGLLGSAMIATGLILWVVKRLPQQRKLGRHAGHRLVECLNVAAIAGLPLAIGVHFWANRLLPVGMDQRSAWEIRAFFIAWLACALHAAMRRHRQAWQEQCAAVAIVYGFLPVSGLLFAGSSLLVTLPAGNWLLAGVDLSFLTVAGFALVAFWYLRTPAAAGNPGRKDSATTVAPNAEAGPAIARHVTQRLGAILARARRRRGAAAHADTAITGARSR